MTIAVDWEVKHQFIKNREKLCLGVLHTHNSLYVTFMMMRYQFRHDTRSLYLHMYIYVTCTQFHLFNT